MLARNLLLGLILVIFVSAMAFADGGFYGSVTYIHCDCSWNADQVKIQKIGEVWADYYYIDCYGPGYTTDPDTFEPGWYRLGVVVGEGSDCAVSFPVTVYHGDEWQEVNLTVQGNLPKPDGEGDD